MTLEVIIGLGILGALIIGLLFLIYYTSEPRNKHYLLLVWGIMLLLAVLFSLGTAIYQSADGSCSGQTNVTEVNSSVFDYSFSFDCQGVNNNTLVNILKIITYFILGFMAYVFMRWLYDVIVGVINYKMPPK